MHQYLKAIGFEQIQSQKQLHALLKEVEESFTKNDLLSREEDLDLCEYRKEFAPGVGVAILGDRDVDECLKTQYYFPYYAGTGVTTYADVVIERQMDKDAFVGICEDTKVDISLVFYLQNAVEYIKQLQLNGNDVHYNSVTLSALCNAATILLPVSKSEQQAQEQKTASHNRSQLVSAAKAGDPAAIESLTLEDMDTYSKVSRRLITEDVFSIVDTYIMPTGIECDQYDILGTILNMQEQKNAASGEKLDIFNLEVHDLQFDVCVPANKVMGEPKIGRRFKGTVWLQGRVNF